MRSSDTEPCLGNWCTNDLSKWLGDIWPCVGDYQADLFSDWFIKSMHA